MQLVYVIKYVDDMDRAVAFHRDKLGLPPGMITPFWSEFETGGTKLALHPASDANPAGSCEVGLRDPDLEATYARRDELGIEFAEAPRHEHGTMLARIRDGEGGSISVSG